MEIAGARLYYKEKGEGSAVLFLHGGGGTSELRGDCFDRTSAELQGVCLANAACHLAIFK